MFFILTLGSTRKSCVAQKTVVPTKQKQNKKKNHIEVNVAQKNYVSHKKICYGNKKNDVVPKNKTHVD